MKYKKIIGGTQEEAEKKFPWLKIADFENAVIDITRSLLIWEFGFWLDGLWSDGRWKNGIWLDGEMWSNLHQKYIKVEYKHGKFKEKKE